MTPATPVLALEGVAFDYPGHPVLTSVDLTLPAGVVHGLLGPNGAGKSTLFQLIRGRLRPAAGRIRLLGHPPDTATVRRHLGWVPQGLALYPHLTVRENLEVFARLWGVARRSVRERVADVLVAGQLAGRGEVRVDRLSGGYQRRVNIAVALLHHPHLLLLDEPTVGVDSEARQAVQQVLHQLAAGGMTILLTTHDGDEAAALCSSASRLMDGRLQPLEETA